jgi:hypothetical protein
MYAAGLSDRWARRFVSLPLAALWHTGARRRRLSARNSTEGQLFIGVPNAGNSQKEEVYATPVMSASGLGLQLQSMMTDNASVATWEGVFEAASVEVLTDVAEVTNHLRRGTEDLHMGLTAKKKPRFCPSGEGILESELV